MQTSTGISALIRWTAVAPARCCLGPSERHPNQMTLLVCQEPTIGRFVQALRLNNALRVSKGINMQLAVSLLRGNYEHKYRKITQTLEKRRGRLEIQTVSYLTLPSCYYAANI